MKRMGIADIKCQGKDNAALRCTIKFRQNNSIYTDCIVKKFCLRKCILASSCI